MVWFVTFSLSEFHPLRSPHHDLDLLPVGEDTEPAQEGDEGVDGHADDDADVVNVEQAGEDDDVNYFNPHTDWVPDQSGKNELVFGLANAIDEETVGDQGGEVQQEVDDAPGQGHFVEQLQVFYAEFTFELLYNLLKFINKI